MPATLVCASMSPECLVMSVFTHPEQAKILPSNLIQLMCTASTMAITVNLKSLQYCIESKICTRQGIRNLCVQKSQDDCLSSTRHSYYRRCAQEHQVSDKVSRAVMRTRVKQHGSDTSLLQVKGKRLGHCSAFHVSAQIPSTKRSVSHWEASRHIVPACPPAPTCIESCL